MSVLCYGMLCLLGNNDHGADVSIAFHSGHRVDKIPDLMQCKVTRVMNETLRWFLVRAFTRLVARDAVRHTKRAHFLRVQKRCLKPTFDNEQ